MTTFVDRAFMEITEVDLIMIKIGVLAGRGRDIRNLSLSLHPSFFPLLSLSLLLSPSPSVSAGT